VELTQQVLIVAAQVLIAQGNSQIRLWRWGDHEPQHVPEILRPEELKLYIDQVLGVDAVPVALGIYFVFRDEAQAQNFRAARFRSRSPSQVQLSNNALRITGTAGSADDVLHGAGTVADARGTA
jgi:hypothetical protein